jgi:alanyl-tRNA synthetase
VISGVLRKYDEVILRIDPIIRKNCSNNHSATHLLHAVLQKVLGSHVKQMGSLVTSDYLRFDFIHLSALSKCELKEIENIINKYIKLKLPIVTNLEFNSDDNKIIRTVSIGDDVSKEFCAGTHAVNTDQLFLFKIIREYGIGNGIRRIEALTGNKVVYNFEQHEKVLNEILEEFKSNKDNILENIQKLISKNKKLKKENNFLASELLKHDIINDKNYILVNPLKIVILNIFVISYHENEFELKISMNLSKNLTCKVNVADIVDYLKSKIELRGGGSKYVANIFVSNDSITFNDVYKIIYSYLHDNLNT